MDTYNSFEQVLGEILHNKEIEFKSLCLNYESIFGLDCYNYQRHRPFDDSLQEIDYNLLTDLVEYICKTTLIKIKFIDDKMIPTHYFTTGYLPIGYLEPPYGTKYILCQSKIECKRILRGIYWLLFSNRYKLTIEDRKYLRRKISTQRIYEFENNKKVIPDYIYQFYTMILYFDRKVYKEEL
jgi:hypothetical protein